MKVPGMVYIFSISYGTVYKTSSPYNVYTALGSHIYHCDIETRLAKYAPERLVLINGKVVQAGTWEPEKIQELLAYIQDEF